MKTLKWTYIDKTTWGIGPWTDEVDKIQWLDEATSLPCLIVRGPIGNLCGYVGVNSTHPYFQKSYNLIEHDIDVHGGLTFSDKCQKAVEGVCHLVENNEDDNVWWFGFDCGHYQDVSPKMLSYGPIFKCQSGQTYKTIEYVREQVLELAKQLKELSKTK